MAKNSFLVEVNFKGPTDGKLLRSCSIITSRIGGGLVSAFFVMLRDGKQEGEWYFMKGHNVMS